MMIPLEVPLSPEAFGGEPEELEAVQRYASALAELRKSRRGREASSSDDEKGDKPQAPGKKNKKKDKRIREAAAVAAWTSGFAPEPVDCLAS